MILLTPRLDLRQSQTLVMTPQLQQAIKLLQMSNLELSSYVEQELEKNPLLERRETSDSQDGRADGAREETSSPLETLRPGDHTSLEFPTGGTRHSNTLERTRISGTGGNTHFDMNAPDIAQTLSEGETLQQHMLQQLFLEITDPADRLIGAHLIGSLNEAGYITDDLTEVSVKLGCTQAQTEVVLKKLQGFDPVGVCARTLQECLSLQLQERDRCDPAMRILLEHLDLVARRDIPALCKLCRLDGDDIADMINEIRALDPKPGLAFQHEVVQTLIPDIFLRWDLEDGWIVELNSETLPKVLINMRYHQRVAGTAHNKADKAYLSDCLHSANWLVKALDQRAQTILKVASELVRQQENFFTHGVRYLRPLNLRAIAEAVDMHESTISRVTSNKYIASARGIHELKYFFTSAIAAADGGLSYSAETVRQKIKALIEAETPSQVLSDDKIVEILVASGMDIARRTVAKYRESLRIPSSIQRRRLKQRVSLS